MQEWRSVGILYVICTVLFGSADISVVAWENWPHVAVAKFWQRAQNDKYLFVSIISNLMVLKVM